MYLSRVLWQVVLSDVRELFSCVVFIGEVVKECVSRVVRDRV